MCPDEVRHTFKDAIASQKSTREFERAGSIYNVVSETTVFLNERLDPKSVTTKTIPRH